MSDLLWLVLNLTWAALALTFLTSAGRVYLHRVELPAPHSNGELPTLTIIIPVRDEAGNIGDCLQCIMGLDYPEGALEVVVVDDGSSDETVSIVEKHAALDPRIRLIASGPLPEGWTGKSRACWQGVQAASGDWLLFIDADTYLKPPAARAALEHAIGEGFQLLSVIPFQRIVSFQERIALPGIFLRFSSAIDFGRVNDPDDPFAIANGQFLLFSREGYEGIGGHEAIRAEVSDDLAFARAAKRENIPFFTLFGEQQVETRMYRSLREIWNGFSKNAGEIMHSSSVLHTAADALMSLGLAAGVMLPFIMFWAVEQGDSMLWSLSATLSVATFATLALFFTLAFRALRVPAVYLFALPLGLAIHAAITINAFIRNRTGSREWKGRRY